MTEWEEWKGFWVFARPWLPTGLGTKRGQKAKSATRVIG